MFTFPNKGDTLDFFFLSGLFFFGVFFLFVCFGFALTVYSSVSWAGLLYDMK